MKRVFWFERMPYGRHPAFDAEAVVSVVRQGSGDVTVAIDEPESRRRCSG